MSLRRVPFGFTPLSITGCQLWLDGADPAGNRVIPANGATVSTWNDKSGNGYTAAATGSPTYVAGGGVNFNGSSYFLNQTFSQNLSQRSIFIVFQETTNTQFAGVFSIIPTPSSGNDQSSTNGLSSEITNNTLIFVGNSIGYQSSIGSGNPLPKGIYHDSMNGTIGSGYFNGTNATNVTAGYTAGTCSGYGLGGRWQGGSMSGSYRLNGVIYEILFFNSVLGTTQRQQVESYLAQKWGTTASLPVGHPGLTTTVFKADYIKNSAIIRNSARPIPYFAAFSPRQIPGCSLWMDGADSSTMTTASGYISAWTSKGTNALSFTQATSSKQPLLVANVYNGYSVVRCINPGDPVVNVFIDTVNNAVLQTGASFCIFIVHNPTIANGSPFCFQNGGGNRIACHLTENGNVVFDTPNVRLTYAAPGNYLTSGLKLDVFWSVANAINYRASGTATASASAGPSSWIDGTLTFGSFTPTQTSYYYQTDIGEIIWFNTALALTQVQQVESYLAQKWGLTAALPGAHSHFTQRAGAITTVANTKFKVVGLPRITFASTGLVITHQDGRTWKATANNPGYANYAIGLNSGTSMSLDIYAGADVFNSAGGRVALFYNGDSNNAVRHAGYVMWTSTFAANNFDFGWKFVSSGSGYLIYNDYPSYSSWQVTYDSGADRVLIVAPEDGRYGMVWNITPRVTLAYVYSSY